MAPAAKKQKTAASPASQFDQLAGMSTLVADTGEISAIKKYKPTDATTNPSLIYKATGMKEYAHLVDDAVKYVKDKGDAVPEEERLMLAMDKLSVNFGAEISKHVPGYVSTEVDARLSFDAEGSVERAKRIIGLYKEVGVDKSRILIKLASTWEGTKAAEVLQKEGITCNMTLIFSLCQAIACAEVGATLISPFVGRILDWYKKSTGKDSYPIEEDPGVLSVKAIYGYYKKFGYNTIVMGASFRSKEQVLALAGCDRLTIAPTYLEELKNCTEDVKLMLQKDKADEYFPGDKITMDEKTFRLMLNDDAMATEKLSSGIRDFSSDIVKLEQKVTKMLVEAGVLTAKEDGGAVAAAAEEGKGVVDNGKAKEETHVGAAAAAKGKGKGKKGK